MATDFFQRQSDAYRSTTWLVVMFCLAVLLIVGSVVVVAALVVQSTMKEPGQSLAQHPEQVTLPVLAGAIALLLIIGGTLFKVLDLRSGGGTRVAESLGGSRLYPDTRDKIERRLLNVVEEMAIASGTPVPPVFMLEEDGINAFAAGYSPSDAVLGVTRGCAAQLTRDELQGVIAHEFSHILNGDMRMSIRLIGILHGILLLGLTGHLIFRLFFYSGGMRSRRSSSNNSNGQVMIVIVAIGVALIILGFIGTLFGNLIKAAVSRQREFLADASAVQFTRNPQGIAGALKRIGAVPAGSKLEAPGATEASHMYFAQGVWEGFSGLWATHPPLGKRILAIDPAWDGTFPDAEATDAVILQEGAAGFAGSSVRTLARPTDEVPSEVPVEVLSHAVDQVGEPTMAHRDYATTLLSGLPKQLLQTAREPYGSRAVVYSLLLDREPAIRAHQMTILGANTTADIVRLVRKLEPLVDQLDVKARLPLIELALPALRAMSASQYGAFSRCFVELAKADSQISLFEWMLSQVLMRHLRPQFEPVRSPRIRYYGLKKLQAETSTLLSIVAAAGNSDDVAHIAFDRGASHLSEVHLVQRERTEHSLDNLRAILARLALVSAKHRGRLVDACAAAICADQHVTREEAELLRGISDLLDCPMPPLLAGGTSR